jgi:hypothetical protein
MNDDLVREMLNGSTRNAGLSPSGSKSKVGSRENIGGAPLYNLEEENQSASGQTTHRYNHPTLVRPWCYTQVLPTAIVSYTGAAIPQRHDHCNTHKISSTAILSVTDTAKEPLYYIRVQVQALCVHRYSHPTQVGSLVSTQVQPLCPQKYNHPTQ